MNPFLPTDPTLKQLAAAICAQPDEDTPRLLYADRLDELAGAPRKCGCCKGKGRFSGTDKKTHRCEDCGGSGKSPDLLSAHAAKIRRQVADYRDPKTVQDPTSWTWYTQHSDPASVWTGRAVTGAFTSVADPWATGMCGYPGPPVRGFPEFVCVAGAEWLRIVPKLVGVWPLRKVHLVSLPPVRVETSRDGEVCRVRWYGRKAPGWQDYTGPKGEAVALPGRKVFYRPSDTDAAKWLLLHTRGWEKITFTYHEDVQVDAPDGGRPLYETLPVDDVSGLQWGDDPG